MFAFRQNRRLGGGRRGPWVYTQGFVYSRRFDREAGVTLLEMIIVVALIAIMAGLAYPSVSAGMESLRLRAAADSIASFLTSSLDHADRRQQVMELQIQPAANVMLARTADQQFQNRLEIPDFVRIIQVLPAVPGAPVDQARRFLVYPGGAVPQIAVEILSPGGRHRIVRLDPVTAVAHTEDPLQGVRP